MLVLLPNDVTANNRKDPVSLRVPMKNDNRCCKVHSQNQSTQRAGFHMSPATLINHIGRLPLVKHLSSDWLSFTIHVSVSCRKLVIPYYLSRVSNVQCFVLHYAGARSPRNSSQNDSNQSTSPHSLWFLFSWLGRRSKKTISGLPSNCRALGTKLVFLVREATFRTEHSHAKRI